jgi:hypothetical protein
MDITLEEEGSKDKLEDPRSAQEQLRDEERALQDQLARGELDQEDYEKRVAELEQTYADFERGRELDRDQPPGEAADANQIVDS